MGNGMLQAIGLAIAFIIFHSSLSMDEVGIWFFVQSIIAFCEAGRAGFLSTAAVKFYAGTTYERGRTVQGSIWYLAIIATGIILTLNACLLPFLSVVGNREFELCVEWVGISFLATLPSDVISWRLQAEERYGAMLRFRILNSVCSIISFTILIVFHEMTLENAFFFNFLINVATSALGMLLKLSGLRNITYRTKECINEIIHYGKFTFGSYLGANLLAHMDTWIINFMLGPKSVAIYNLAKRFMAIVDLPLRSFAVTGMSAMAIAYNNNNLSQVTYTFKKYAGMLTVAFVPIAVLAFFFGDIPVNMLGGEDYHKTEAASAFKILMFVAILYPMDTLNGVTLDIIHKTKINFQKVLLMIGLRVVCDFSGLMVFNNVYGVVASIFVVRATAMLYGNYQLQKSLSFTIPGIVTTGFKETRFFLRSLAFK